MLKKVKQKQYKSKKEFKDDLDLIWSNCFQYNAAEVCYLSAHPVPTTVTPMLRTTLSASAPHASKQRPNTSSSISPIGRSAPILAFLLISPSLCLAAALRLTRRPS